MLMQIWIREIFKAKIDTSSVGGSKAKSVSNAESVKNTNAKPGSMMAKANMVKDYNEKNNNR